VTIQEAATPTNAAGARPVASYADAARVALPTVVHIFTSKEVKAQRHPFADDPLFRHFFGDRLDNRPQQRASGLGSGVIVSPEGYVLTNNHVIEAADEIEVALNDGRKLPARIVGRDPESDLAVLQIKADGKLKPSPSAHRTLHVGDVVLAIGNPFGVGQTVTMGIVSALGRSHLGINTFEDFIQTDAAINPGNSGGALIDAAGTWSASMPPSTPAPGLSGHRLRDPRLPGPQRDGANHPERLGHPRLDRRRSPGHHCRARRIGWSPRWAP
jgi:serine protease DegS/serine protease DegQ